MKKEFIVTILFLTFALNTQAQYDTEHYIPPFYGNCPAETEPSNTKDLDGELSIYLSTHENEVVPVSIYTTSETGERVLLASKTISKNQPIIYELGSPYDGTLLTVEKTELALNLFGKGLVLTSTKPFYANVRYQSNSQGASLTSKGSLAKGTEFFTGHMFSISSLESNPDKSSNKYNSQFFSIMATENNTEVNINNPRVKWLNDDTSDWENENRKKTKVKSKITLKKGQSVVFAIDNDEYDNHLISNTSYWENNFSENVNKHFKLDFSSELIRDSRNYVNGTHITSTNPIVVNCGTWSGSPVNKSARDVGIDQITPISIIGNEYILMKGNGKPNMDEGVYGAEHATIIATKDKTNIWINGKLIDHKFNTGEYYITTVLDFDKDEGNTMHIKADNPCYVYQTAQGSQELKTTGLNFIPSLSCMTDRYVTIASSKTLSSSRGEVTAVINILGKSSSINYTSDNKTESILPVQKNVFQSGWNLYKVVPTNNSAVHIDSNEAVNVSLNFESEAVGAAGFFTGFSTAPRFGENYTNLVMNGMCADNMNLTAYCDNAIEYRWYRNEKLILNANNTPYNEATYEIETPAKYSACALISCDPNEAPIQTPKSTELDVLPCMNITFVDQDQNSVTDFTNVPETIGDLEIVFNLSHSVDSENSFHITTIPSQTSPATEGEDYFLTSKEIVFGKETTTTSNITIVNDEMIENTEMFSIDFTESTYAQASPARIDFFISKLKTEMSIESHNNQTNNFSICENEYITLRSETRNSNGKITSKLYYSDLDGTNEVQITANNYDLSITKEIVDDSPTRVLLWSFMADPSISNKWFYIVEKEVNEEKPSWNQTSVSNKERIHINARPKLGPIQISN